MQRRNNQKGGQRKQNEPNKGKWLEINKIESNLTSTKLAKC